MSGRRVRTTAACALLVAAAVASAAEAPAEIPKHEGGAGATPAKAPTEPVNAAAAREATFDLGLQVVAGTPPVAVRDADVSVDGLDGLGLAGPARPDKNGRVHFDGLTRADVRVTVVAPHWATLKTTLKLAKSHEDVKLTLKPMPP